MRIVINMLSGEQLHTMRLRCGIDIIHLVIFLKIDPLLIMAYECEDTHIPFHIYKKWVDFLSYQLKMISRKKRTIPEEKMLKVN